MLHVGNTARYLRERIGLNQRQASELLQISTVHLSNIENNKSLPSPKLLDRYHQLWGVDLYILAWCLHGDVSKLPLSVRKAMTALANAWKKDIQKRLPNKPALGA
jgi:transcriptional regulator with XRE-family HTH domain